MNGKKRRVFLDMHFPDWPNRQTSTNFDPNQIASAMIDNHVDSVILYAKCQYGNFYYDTKIGHKHKGLGALNLFVEVSSRLKAAGIEVIAYYSVAWDELISAEHPQWLVVGPNGEQDNLGEFRWSTLCVNSPYRELVFAHLREISSMLRPDGFWIDMTIIGKDRCFCPHCQALHLKQTGELLTPATLSDERQINQFLRFRYDYIEAFYKDAYRAIREILPHANLANNYWGYPYSWPTMGSRAAGALREANFVTGEAYTDWTGLSAPGFFSKFLRSVGAGRPFEALIGRFLGTWDFTAKPETQLMLEAFTIASNGGTVTIDDEPFADGQLDLDVYRSIGKAFGEIEARARLLCGKPVRFAAILHAQLSKDSYHRGIEAFMQGFAGAYRLLRELQCPAEMVFDETLDENSLAGYQLLLIPSAALIQPEVWAHIEAFMKRGGLVIATGPTGMYRLENGVLTPDGAIAERMGFRTMGMSDVSLSYLSAGDATLKARLPKRPQLVRGAYVRAKAEGAQVLATVIEPICETGGKVFFHNNLPAPYEPTDYPALTRTVVGGGRFCWFSQDLFGQFARYHQVEIMTIVQSLMDELGIHSPVGLSCASNVEFALAELPGGNAVLHLVNFTPGMGVCCSAMDTFEGRYARTFEFVDKVNAVSDIEIRVTGEYEMAAGYMSGPLKTHVENGETIFVLPRLSMWESIELS